MQTVIYASRNQGKLKEVLTYAQLGEVDLALALSPVKLSVAETGSSYQGNAGLKARAYAETLRQPVVADDGGLELAAFPEILGLETARFFPAGMTDLAMNQRLLDLYQEAGVLDRRCRLVTCLAYFDPARQKAPTFFQAEQEFLISDEPQGHQGFGFDPILYIESLDRTCGQLDDRQRSRYSPRIQAFNQWLAWFQAD